MKKKISTVIGIGGVSRAGKSTLANSIKTWAISNNYSCRIICQDDYTHPTITLPYVYDLIDWEDPSGINFEHILSEVNTSINKAIDFVIVEGLFAFYDEKLNALYNHQIYTTIEYDEFLKRKKADRRWNKDGEPLWYIQHIWDSHQKYGLPDYSHRVLIVEVLI